VTYLTDFIGQSVLLHVLSMGESVADILHSLYVGVISIIANVARPFVINHPLDLDLIFKVTVEI
jgi:hypothetical protein